MKRYKKQRMEFSKKILLFMFIIVSLVVLFSFIAIIITHDTSPLSYLITSVFGEFGVGTLFYYKKAERENIIKLKKTNKDISFDDTSFSSNEDKNETFG